MKTARPALGIPVLQLGSPASHDAAAFAAAGVPIGMIFIRNENGSHNPHEAMAIDDFMAGVSLLTWYLIATILPRSRKVARIPKLCRIEPARTCGVAR